MLHTLQKSLIALLILAPTIVFIGTAPVDSLVRLFPDDAFYYLQAAHNFVITGIPSFDGVTPTNGVQPFQFALTSLNALAADKNTMLRLAVIENAIWVVMTAWVAAYFLTPSLNQRQRLLSFIIIAMPCWYLYIWLDAGMEIGPVFFFSVLFYVGWCRAREQKFCSTRLNCMLSCTAVMMFLSRLDMVIALLPFCIVALYHIWRHRPPTSAMVAPIALAMLIICPYLLSNQIFFGHPVPISGIVKSSALVSFAANWRSLSAGSATGAAIFVLPLFTAAVALIRARGGRQRGDLVCLAAALLVYYCYLLFFAAQVFRWYLAFPLAVQAIALAIILDRSLPLSNVSNRFWPLLTLLLLTLFSQHLLYKWIGGLNTTTLQLKKITEQINRRTGDHDVIATFDAGVVGYFSRARVVNLDGLANSLEYYQNYLQHNNFRGYFDAMGVSYFLARKSLILGFEKQPDAAPGVYIFSYDPRIQFDDEMLIEEYDIPGQFSLALFKY